jgi:membrane-associated phospholipid phosphatase
MPRASRHVAGLLTGTSILIASGALARRRRSDVEIHLFRAANRLSDRAYWTVWVPMQYGTFATAPTAAALALALRRPRLALAIASGGTSAWLLAKVAKRFVDRGRPASVTEGVVQRGHEEGGRGFPSGHAAVSTALTVVAWPYLPKEWRLIAATLSGFVPFARMYVGAHLPLDVIGGSALGLAIGSAVNLASPPGGEG